MGRGICPFTYSILSVLGRGCSGSLPSALPPCLCYPQVVTEAHPTVMIRTSNFQGSAGMREAPERPYSCDDCGKRYSQRQGVSRHRQKAHNNPHSCCVPRCKFKWNRPDLYRAHLKKRHSDVNPDVVLGKRAGSRRRSMIIGRDLFQQFPPPAFEPDRRSRAEPRQRPMTPPLPALANVTHVPSPALLPVSCDLQPEYAEPTISTYELEDAHGFEASSAFSSTEACAYWHSMNDFDAFT